MLSKLRAPGAHVRPCRRNVIRPAHKSHPLTIADLPAFLKDWEANRAVEFRSRRANARSRGVTARWGIAMSHQRHQQAEVRKPQRIVDTQVICIFCAKILISFDAIPKLLSVDRAPGAGIERDADEGRVVELIDLQGRCSIGCAPNSPERTESTRSI